MLKKLFLLGLLLFGVPVLAGQYEDALRTGEPVFLYMHTNYCRYCKEFNPIFDKLVQNNKKKYHFVKVNAESPYGYLLMRDLRAGYVPFVALSDAKRHYFLPIAPSCAIETACIEQEMAGFLKQ